MRPLRSILHTCQPERVYYGGLLRSLTNSKCIIDCDSAVAVGFSSAGPITCIVGVLIFKLVPACAAATGTQSGRPPTRQTLTHGRYVPLAGASSFSSVPTKRTAAVSLRRRFTASGI